MYLCRLCAETRKLPPTIQKRPHYDPLPFLSPIFDSSTLHPRASASPTITASSLSPPTIFIPVPFLLPLLLPPFFL